MYDVRRKIAPTRIQKQLQDICIATRYTNSKGKTSEHGQTSKYNHSAVHKNTVCGLRYRQNNDSS